MFEVIRMELGFKHNIGPIDRTVRLLAALALTGLTYFGIINIRPFTSAVLYIIAGFLLVEAVSGY